MSHITINRQLNPSMGFNASLIFLIFAALLSITDAKGGAIGVFLTDRSEEEMATKGDDDGLLDLMDPVQKLNRFIFEKTILEAQADEVAHWIVLFCPPWYEPCQALEPVYRKLTDKWQEQLNGALMKTEVRFASVDCATEKALCNTQNVDTYPFVAHYQHHEQVKTWRGKSFASDANRLRDFLQKELGPVAAVLAAAQIKKPDNWDDEEDGVWESPIEDGPAEPGLKDIPVDFLLIFAAIAGNAWFISRGSVGGEASLPMAPSAKLPMEGLIPPSSPCTAPPTSCVTRSLPQEWARERASLEL